MAYRLGYSDYLPPAAPPAPAVVPPTPESIPGGPSFIGLPQPPDVPCDPTGDGWRGPPGPPGPSGVGVFLPLAGGTMTGALLLRGDPAASLEAASKHYVDQQTAVGTPPGGPFLALIGGSLSGNLTINKTTTYTGNTASLSDAALNIAQTSSGNITGTGEVDHNSLVITDTLSVNPPANVIASFQAQIDGTTLSLNSLASPPVAVPFTGSISGNTLTILSGIPGLAPGSTVQWSGGTDMVQIAAGPGLWTLYNTHGTVSSQAMTGLANTFSVMGSVSGSTLTITSAYGPGAITAGMQVQWNLPTPGATTIITGPAGGPYTLVNPSGTIPLQPMLLLGPQPAQTVTWDSGDPDNPGTATVGSYITGHPAQFSLLTNQGTVSSRPMQTVKAIQNRNVFGFSSYLNFGGGDGSRYGWRLNISQTAAMAGHAYYLPAYIVNNLRYPSGGTDLWAGAKGAGWAGNTVMNFIKPATTAAGDPGPINYRGGSSWEFDYQCLAGSPDDPAWPKASTASLGGIAVIRGGQSTWETPMWEADYAIAIAQAGPSVRDASNNIVPPKRAKYGIRFNGLSGIPTLDPSYGRAIAAVYPPGAFATDGSLGLYPNVAPFGVDWLSMDYTRAAYRWRGGAVLGSATPLPGALAIGGGYLSATNTTVSLDTAGSVCTGATVAPGQGGANCYLGMVCQDDVSGTQVVVTGVDGAVSPRIGAATTVLLIARTGQSHNAEIPTNPVQFRPMGNPLTFLAPGPTGPKLNLTWTAPTTLSVQPSGGATVFGGPVTLPAAGTGLTVTNNATVGGVLTVGAAASTTDETIQIMSTAGHNRLLNIYNGSLLRWGIGADVTAENGSNTGSLFQIATYNDAGGFVGALLKGNRGSGPGGTGGPYISTMRPYVMPTPRATVPGGVVGNDRTFPTAGVDVQPITTLGTDPLSVTSGSAVVNITWTGCGAAGGVFQAGLTECYVNLLGATATGGITPTGWLKGTRVDNNTFSITWTSNATSTATGGGTAVTVQPNFSSITEKVYSTLTAGTAGFPMQSQRLFVANPAFYKVIGGGGGAGPQYQQEWRQVFTPNDTSGLNDWGLAATELDLVNRGADTGYNPNLFIAKNLTVGIWTGALGVSPMPAYAPGGGVATNWNTVFGIFASKNAANYVGYSVQPNALVGQTLDTVTSHGGVAFVAFGSHSLINAFNYTNGSSVITVTLQTASALTRQVNGNSVYIPTVQTVGGVTFGGASYVIAGVTATTFTIIGTGTAGSTGSLAVSQWAAFANLVPYAPMDLQGSWKHGISTTNFRSEDGSIINTQPGNGLLWGDGTGTASINSSVSTAGNINVILAPAGTGAVMVAGAAGPTITSGSAAPASTQPKGSLYCRTGGGVATTLYVSQGGGTWNAVAGV